MRRIIKGAPDPALARRHQSPPKDARGASDAWEKFRKERNRSSMRATRDKCLQEQYHLCGYSEVALNDHTPIHVGDDSGIDSGAGSGAGSQISRDLGVHIEHIEPKSRKPQRTFDHNNLIACAIDDSKARGLNPCEVFGGHAKKNYYSPDFIHPLMANCRDFFHFEVTTGKVLPCRKKSRRDQARARLTIYILNLNSPVLLPLRKAWLDAVQKNIQIVLGNQPAVSQLCAKLLHPRQGKLKPFHSATRQLFGTTGQQVCSQHNPPL